MIHHTSVLVSETLESLKIHPGDWICDCTVGAGGHSLEFLKATGPKGLVVGIDQDPDALKIANQTLSANFFFNNYYLMHGNFSDLKNLLNRHQITENRLFDVIFADIGVSSMQLDTPERGFSFRKDGPLDMRMGNISPHPEYPTAYDFINGAPLELLVKVFRHYGEEQFSKNYAIKICEAREREPFSSTLQLAEFIKSLNRYKASSKKHPATKIFQAVRIFINRELEALEALINQSLELLKPGGKLAIITFHSLEDRIVKELYLKLSDKNPDLKYPREVPLTHQEITSKVKTKGHIIKPFPMKPTMHEVASNPRARSAKLRVFAKSL